MSNESQSNNRAIEKQVLDLFRYMLSMHQRKIRETGQTLDEFIMRSRSEEISKEILERGLSIVFRSLSEAVNSFSSILYATTVAEIEDENKIEISPLKDMCRDQMQDVCRDLGRMKTALKTLSEQFDEIDTSRCR